MCCCIFLELYATLLNLKTIKSTKSKDSESLRIHQHFECPVINYRLKLLVLSVHQGFPLLKEFRLRLLDVFQSPFSLDSAIFHGNDLIKTYTQTETEEEMQSLVSADTGNQSLCAL